MFERFGHTVPAPVGAYFSTVEKRYAPVCDQSHRTRSTFAKAIILRWEIEGKVVACTYGLIPDEKAQKKSAPRVWDRDVGCTGGEAPKENPTPGGDGICEPNVRSSAVLILSPAAEPQTLP